MTPGGRRLRLWGAPVVLGLVTLGGLICGLAGDGLWDVLSWTLLGLPVAACAWYGFAR